MQTYEVLVRYDHEGDAVFAIRATDDLSAKDEVEARLLADRPEMDWRIANWRQADQDWPLPDADEAF